LLALHCGTANVDRVQADLDHDAWDRWEAFDAELPLDHSAKMLGLIALWIGQQLKVELPDGITLTDICLPWTSGVDIDQTENAISSLGGYRNG